ncbi:hypothetical protein ASPWEDRAFT_692626 [Aspergillus wentii DTO 134E9]|uniref:Zn(2)-C6 fungal-type domain-containing protein n=1 Tax=Aspergillus wentii DTO 134E9 TaxID=1073089 RepID=A0A1L9R967_ASPWE|nr:uncharacterized protein ASPWEDRAFT_692626 [Aspergillus wentii DTO 134E9]KAI9926498.1 hypothetical protein MW887_004263 [Aspergillus wentii]OJJ31462.1 hypothetical protein ASPWEDRAFT_692626 [Aspergillus wentii DTO 134E9]
MDTNNHRPSGSGFSSFPWDRQVMMMRSSRAPKARPSSSCIPCRNRKVKCNRLDPCETCISRGVANECKYSANDEDRQSIAQAELITDLRATVKGLKGKLSQVEQERHFQRRHASTPEDDDEEQQNGSLTMEIVYAALQSGSPEVVQHLVAMIRSGAPMEEVAAFAEQCVASPS